MSKPDKSFVGKALDALKENAREGLGEMKEEAKRLGLQGQAEIAGALFNGNAFVPYGKGQEPVQMEAEKQKEPEKQHEQEQDGLSL